MYSLLFISNSPPPSLSHSSATTVKNKDAFLVLQNAFLHSQTSHVGKAVIDAIINIYKCNSANFFMLEPLHTLSTFLEALHDKNEDVQVNYINISLLYLCHVAKNVFYINSIVFM